MKTRTLKIVTLAASLALAMSMLTGCIFPLIDGREVHEDGYFQYIVINAYSNNQSTFVAIVGFTDLGLEQGIIDFPREIDGIPVRYIGYDDQVSHTRYKVYSENLKKIYIQDNITGLSYFQDIDKKDVDIMLCAMNDDFQLGTRAFYRNIYVYESMVDKVNDKNRLGYSAIPANTVFMNNYSYEINEGYYRLDNIGNGETIPMPPEPVRSGYEFTGWYTETECVNLWDFNSSPTIEEDTEFRFYAGWREI